MTITDFNHGWFADRDVLSATGMPDHHVACTPNDRRMFGNTGRVLTHFRSAESLEMQNK